MAMTSNAVIRQENFKVYLCMAALTMTLGVLGTVLSYYFHWGLTGTGMFLLLSAAINFYSYYFSHKLILKMSGAKLLQREQLPELFDMVEGLCAGQELPVPRLFLINDASMNAFATGRDRNHSVVAVTRGLLEKLEMDEVRGVVAHEIGHIQNGDMRLMTIVTMAAGFISILADMYWYSMRASRADERDRSGALAMIGFALSVLAPISALLIQLAISRKREFVADALSAQMTRNPGGLADALEKIKHDMRPLPSAGVTMAHLYFSNPFKQGDIIDKLFSTHPPVEERVHNLRQMKGGM
ncbi:MAG: M48 family metalloprotease [Candidatus Omnitrophota bacterium]|jgi:heat shock protein HtpX